VVQGVAGAGLRGRCGAVQRRLCGKDFCELNDGSGSRSDRAAVRLQSTVDDGQNLDAEPVELGSLKQSFLDAALPLGLPTRNASVTMP
jgi:hypothetical protein